MVRECTIMLNVDTFYSILSLGQSLRRNGEKQLKTINT